MLLRERPNASLTLRGLIRPSAPLVLISFFLFQPLRAAPDYGKFLHTTKKHQQACATCHDVPTRNWKSVREFPDVADHPEHRACVSCHRPQFFRGARPQICTVCHTKVSPRDDDRFAFPRSQRRSQFAIEFPHDKHQDVIAQMLRQSELSLMTKISFVHRSAMEAPGDYNNCTICHLPRTKPLNRSWPDNYKPDALTFKTVPTSHAACFNCHWKSQQPVNDNCNGCHKLLPTLAATLELKRISLKFKHEGGGERKNHVAECTTCHINITKSATLRGLRPDVPITACSECHNKDGLRLDVATELARLDKERSFICSYCHTADVGGRNPPVSHYLISGREPLTLRGSE